MTLRQFLAHLNAHGTPIREYDLRNALRNAHIPEPPRSPINRFIYSPEYARLVSHYFKHRRKQGRPKANGKGS